MDQNKVDLSSVNKTKKQLNLPKLKNPFRKKQGPARDQDGKFTTGSGGLVNTKNFNWKRSAPLMLVVALVGGFFVYRSFAATPVVTPAYQYSVSNCQMRVTEKVDSSLAVCQSKSSEAMVFRFYKGLFNRNPDSGGYKYWTQKLAGDREQSTRVAELMLANNKDSNAQFVDNLYKNLLGRSADTSGRKYWLEQLDTNKWTKPRVATHFAASSEAITKQSSSLTDYLKTAPTVTIVENAKKAQANRLTQAKKQANRAKELHDAAKKYIAETNESVEKAKSIAASAKPSASQIDSIITSQNTAKTKSDYLVKHAKELNEIEKSAKSNYNSAKQLSDHAKDISSASVKEQYDKVVVYRTVVTNKSSSSLFKDFQNARYNLSVEYAKAFAKTTTEKTAYVNAINTSCPQGTGKLERSMWYVGYGKGIFGFNGYYCQSGSKKTPATISCPAGYVAKDNGHTETVCFK